VNNPRMVFSACGKPALRKWVI